MESERFDRFARLVSEATSRRSVLRGLTLSGLGAALGLAAVGLDPNPDELAAESKKKRRQERRKKAQRRKRRRQDCNSSKPCAASTNPCQTVSCVDHKCQTASRPNGTSCGTGKVCAGGACVAECAAGSSCSGQTTCCAKACVNTQTSLAHCGACGKACDPAVSDTCASGVCRCGSSAACTSGHICDSGTCVCPPDEDECAGACTNLDTDTDNCGECGRVCAGDDICSNGFTCQDEECFPVVGLSGEAELAANGGITVTADGAVFGNIRIGVPAGTTFGDLATMESDFNYASGHCGAGSPRFVVFLKNGKCPYGQFPPTTCNAGGTGNTGNLIGNETPFDWLDDLCGGSGQGTNTYSEVLALYSAEEVDRITLVTDSSSGPAVVTLNPCVTSA